MARAGEHVHRVFFQVLQAVLPQRPVDVSRLAETAAPDAAPLYLQNHPVLGGLDIGNQGLFNVAHAV